MLLNLPNRRPTQVVGAMLLNLSGRTDDVRRMIRDGARYTSLQTPYHKSEPPKPEIANPRP